MAGIVQWHEIFQDLLEKDLPLLSGRRILEGRREHQLYFRIDFYCVAGEEIDDGLEIVRPFDHLRSYNLIEYKSIHEVLNERVFREYVARALYLETLDPQKVRQGKTTLTIVTARKPVALLKKEIYRFERIEGWKYVSRWIEDLGIFLLVQREMAGEEGGEALALLQALEGEKRRQAETWRRLIGQDLSNVDRLREIFERIDREVFMNLAEKFREEGKREGLRLAEKFREEGKREGLLEGKREGLLEGKRAGLLGLLRWIDPELASRFEPRLKGCQTLEQLEEIEGEIRKALSGTKGR